VNPTDRTRYNKYKYLGALLFLVSIVTLNHLGYINLDRLVSEVRTYRDNPLLIAALIIGQVALYTFALTGSYALWLVAPVYAPVASTSILAVGGTLGAISAYYFSRKMSEKWVQRIAHTRAYRLIRAQNQFLTLFALRVLPGFPHGLISYSAGILKCPPIQFILASMAGFVIKFYLYSSIVHRAADALTGKTEVDIVALSPLIALSVLSLAAVYLRHRASVRVA